MYNQTSCVWLVTLMSYLTFADARYDSDGDSHAWTSLGSRGKERAHDQVVDEEALNDLLHALQTRIVELETINASQDAEITDLRSALDKALASECAILSNISTLIPSQDIAAPTQGPRLAA